MIWGFLWSPPMPLYDGVLVTETKKHGLDYARVRMWSSVAFIFGTFLCGHRRRPLRPALGALCRHGEHRATGAAGAAAAGHAAKAHVRSSRARPRAHSHVKRSAAAA
jgi:hypothetical protein